jgi:tungstate transport system ATP-binding protein
MVTHVEYEALNLAGRIIVMNSGRIAQDGTPSVVMQNPVNEFVAKLVGMENIIDGRVLECSGGLLVISVSGRQVCALGEAHVGKEIVCGIRPENVGICAKHDPEIEKNKNAFSGRITQIFSMGPFLKIQLDCGFPLIALVTRETLAEQELFEGKQIYASIKPASVHIIPTV